MNLPGENKEIIIQGGFKLPDKNAAAHRALLIGKLLSEKGNIVRIIGYSKLIHGYKPINTNSKKDSKIYLYEIEYPKDNISWIKHYICNGFCLNYFNKKDVVKVLLYNSNLTTVIIAILLFGRNKVVLDNTEYFALTNNFSLKKIIKYVDCVLREKVIKKIIYGSIDISSFLNKNYSKRSCIIPPLIDRTDSKWQIQNFNYSEKMTNRIKLVYAGDLGDSKDNLLKVIRFLNNQENNSQLELLVIGISKSEFQKKYGSDKLKEFKLTIVFHGRKSHGFVIDKLKQSDYSIFFREKNKVNEAGFPTKLVESLSTGTPVITNDTSDIRKYLRLSKESILIEDFSKKISVKKKSHLSSLNCQKLAFDNFNYDLFSDHIEKVI